MFAVSIFLQSYIFIHVKNSGTPVSAEQVYGLNTLLRGSVLVGGGNNISLFSDISSLSRGLSYKAGLQSYLDTM